MLCFGYFGKYATEDWWEFGRIWARNGIGFPLTAVYFKLMAWFIGLGLVFLALERIPYGKIFSGLRFNLLGAGLLFLGFSPILWFVGVGLVLEENVLYYSPGLIWHLDWWQIAELAFTGETCNPQYTGPATHNSVNCYSGFFNIETWAIPNADAPNRPWYGFF